jgi:type VI secretion system secreted protein VgrG
MTRATTVINLAARNLLGTDTSQFFLQIADLPKSCFLVESVSLQNWGFHQDFTIELNVLVLQELDDDVLLHAPASVQLQIDAERVTLNGLITDWSDNHRPGDCRGLTLHIASVLHPLKARQHNRVFVDQSATEIAATLLKGSLADLASVNVLCNASPVLPMTVQYHESDYDFIRRILAKEGVFLSLHQDYVNTEIQLCDRLEQLPEDSTTIPQRYITNAGTTKDDSHVFAVEQVHKHTLSHVALNNDSPWSADNLNVLAATDQTTGTTGTELWGLNYHTRDAGQQLAERMAQRLTWQRQTLTLHTTERSIRPGHRVQLMHHPRSSGHYRVIEVHFSGSQRAASGGSHDKAWQCQLTVLPINVSWVPPYQPREPHYAAMSATLTSEVDAQGCYRVRLPFDLRSDNDGLSSPPLRLMQPLGGADHGMHFPLATGTEVSLLFENGDLDRPCIQGALYNKTAENPVTDTNARQNLIRTRGEHQLLFDDTPKHERIHLSTAEDKNHLTLSAAEDNHAAELASEDGELRLRAGKTATVESGDDCQIRVGANHSIHVQQDYRLQTEEGEIQMEAATDIACTAGKAIRLHTTEQSIELSASKTMIMQAGRGLKQQIDDGDCSTRVDKGGYQLSTSAAQAFNSQGNPITVAQGDATVQLDGSGNLTLDASTIELSADQIVIKSNTVSNN